jgi:agmatine/peptidylarginine deiminase
MLRRHPLTTTLVLGTLLAIAGFCAGIGVQASRNTSANPADRISSAGHVITVKPIADLNSGGRILAGFEHQAGLILGVNELILYHPDTLARIVGAIHDRLKIIGVVADEAQEAKTISLLKDRGLPENSIEFFKWPVEAMWVRDYAPYFVVSDHTTVVDFTYPEQNRDLEDNFGLAFAATFGLHYDHAHLTFDGGNLTSNGHGVCISTTLPGGSNASRGYNAAQIGQLLHNHFHFERWIRLKPLEGEPTGHVDMFLTLCAPDKAIVGVYRRDDDPTNSAILDENATLLQGEQTNSGPIQVIRIPMPSHKDGNWRTYTNVIYANGVVLVPQYPDTDPDLDKVALNVFHEALPDWKVEGIDCSKLIVKRGALHCISRQVPSLGDRD